MTDQPTNVCIDPSHPLGDHAHGAARYNRFALGPDFTKDPSLTGPPCIWCNSPTRRAGACWLCPMCGTTTSC